MNLSFKKLEELFAWSEFYRFNNRREDYNKCQKQIDIAKTKLFKLKQ